MRIISKRAAMIAAAMLGLATISAPAAARDWDDRGWHDQRRDHDRRDWDRRNDRRGWDDRRDRRHGYNDVHLRGPGVRMLNPWFRNAKNGRFFAAERAGTHISKRDAVMLNREFHYRGRW